MKRRASCGSAIVQYGLPMGLMGLVGVLVLVGTPGTGLSSSVSNLIGGTLGVSSGTAQNTSSSGSMQVASFGTQSLSAQQSASTGNNASGSTGALGGVLPLPGSGDIGSLPPNSSFGNLGNIGQQPTETGGQTSGFHQLGGGPRDGSGGTRGDIKGQEPVKTGPEQPYLGYCNDQGACTQGGGIKGSLEGAGSVTVPNGGGRVGGVIRGNAGYGDLGELPYLPGNGRNEIAGEGTMTQGLHGPALNPSESAGTSNLTAGGNNNGSQGHVVDLDALSPASNKFAP